MLKSRYLGWSLRPKINEEGMAVARYPQISFDYFEEVEIRRSGGVLLFELSVSYRKFQ